MMMFVLFLLVIFALIISIELGLSIGIAYILTWLLPNISFEMGVLIGAICSNCTIYFFLKVTIFSMEREMYFLNKINSFDEEYDEDLEEEADYQIIPTPPSRKKRTQKRKR